MGASSVSGVFKFIKSVCWVAGGPNTHVQPNDLQPSCGIQSLPHRAVMVAPI